MIFPIGSTLGKKRSLRSAPRKHHGHVALIFDIGEEAALVHLGVAHCGGIGRDPLEAHGPHHVGAVGDGSRTRTGDPDLAHQPGAALDERVLLPGQLRISLLRLKKFPGVLNAGERRAQHAESVVAHVGGAVGDIHIHSMDQGDHGNQRPGGQNDAHQRQDAAELARSKRIERQANGFDKRSSHCFEDTIAVGALFPISSSQPTTSASSQNRGRRRERNPRCPPCSTATSRR